MAQKPVLRSEVGCACVAREVSIVPKYAQGFLKHQLKSTTHAFVKDTEQYLICEPSNGFMCWLKVPLQRSVAALPPSFQVTGAQQLSHAAPRG